ncbi:hypothetical protein AX14_003181 [Amanita brunnescens Koide BX004]|nr:hypothetical protein AX14_003181 [Amanita brunnescens Koide BX004]
MPTPDKKAFSLPGGGVPLMPLLHAAALLIQLSASPIPVDWLLSSPAIATAALLLPAEAFPMLTPLVKCTVVAQQVPSPLPLSPTSKGSPLGPTNALLLPHAPTLLHLPDAEVLGLPRGGFTPTPAVTHVTSGSPTPSPAMPGLLLICISTQPPPWPNIADIATLPMSIVLPGASDSTVSIALNTIRRACQGLRHYIKQMRRAFQVF